MKLCYRFDEGKPLGIVTWGEPLKVKIEQKGDNSAIFRFYGGDSIDRAEVIGYCESWRGDTERQFWHFDLLSIKRGKYQ